MFAPLAGDRRKLFFHKYIFDWILHNRLVECMSINGNNGRMIFCLAERMRSEPSTTKPTKTTDKNPIKSIVYKFSANIQKKIIQKEQNGKKFLHFLFFHKKDT